MALSEEWLGTTHHQSQDRAARGRAGTHGPLHQRTTQTQKYTPPRTQGTQTPTPKHTNTYKDTAHTHRTPKHRNTMRCTHRCPQHQHTQCRGSPAHHNQHEILSQEERETTDCAQWHPWPSARIGEEPLNTVPTHPSGEWRKRTHEGFNQGLDEKPHPPGPPLT